MVGCPTSVINKKKKLLNGATEIHSLRSLNYKDDTGINGQESIVQTWPCYLGGMNDMPSNPVCYSDIRQS